MCCLKYMLNNVQRWVIKPEWHRRMKWWLRRERGGGLLICWSRCWFIWELIGCARKRKQPLGKGPLKSRKLSALQSIVLNGRCKTLSRRKAEWSDIMEKDMRSEGKIKKCMLKKPQPGSKFRSGKHICLLTFIEHCWSIQWIQEYKELPILLCLMHVFWPPRLCYTKIFTELFNCKK